MDLLVHLAEINVYETDLVGWTAEELVAMSRPELEDLARAYGFEVSVGGVERPSADLIGEILARTWRFGVNYHQTTPAGPAPFAVLVRNERFVSPDGRSIGP